MTDTDTGAELIQDDDAFIASLDEVSADESVEIAEESEGETSELNSADEVSEESEESGESKEFDEDHDPMATLKDEEASKEESSFETRYPKGAINLANKFDTLTDEDKAVKVASLLNTKGRETELAAIAEAQGVSVEDLVDIYTETKEPTNQQVDIDALVEAKLEEKLSGHIAQSERVQFTDEVQKWAAHNKIKDTAALTTVTSEVYKAFTESKFDPRTGEKLGFQGRLKQALSTETAQGELIKAGAIKGAEKIFKGVNAKLRTGGGENGKTGQTFDEQMRAIEKEAQGY